MKRQGNLARVDIAGLTLWIDAGLEQDGILAAFTTRVGGCSRTPYDSLNLALHTLDEKEAVLDNRRRLARALGMAPDRLTFVEQVHGADVVRIDEGLAGAGADPLGPVPPQADAMVTDVPNLPLVVLTADCVPIILAEPKRKIIGAVHAGWRGTLDRIAAKAAAAMAKAGADVNELIAVIGPSIGPCCYGVGHDLYERFTREFSLAAGADPATLNLAELNRSVLAEAGIPGANIRQVAMCTKDNPELFYSWRRDGDTGRQAAVAALLTPKT